MKRVLIINASVRDKKSQSRKLTELFMENWKQKYPEDIFTFREVGLNVVPPIDESWIASAFTNPKNRTEANQKGVRLSNIL